MAFIDEQHIGDYEFQICAYVNSSGSYQGVILVTAYAGRSYSPIIEIRTPTCFKAQRAAHIEAEAVIIELIKTETISKFLPA